MKIRLEEAIRVLELCRQARLTPTSEIAGTLLKLADSSLPPRLLKAANDAIFFALMDEEKSDAIPLEELPALIDDESEASFVESQAAD